MPASGATRTSSRSSPASRSPSNPAPRTPPGAFAAAGGAPGLNALLESGLGERYTLVVLANLDPAAEDIGAQVRDWLGVRDKP